MRSTFDERDVLLKAASRVEQGWCQGHAFRDAVTGVEQWWGEVTESSLVCFSGVVSLAEDELGVYNHGQIHARVWSRMRSAIGGAHPLGWNDAPGRTAAEVAEAMRRAAE